MSAPASGPPPARRRRTQAERREASEGALLQAAAELITEVGVERASLRSIGARAGVSRAMPAYHFGSKDNLVSRLVQRAYGRTLEAATLSVRRHGGDIERLSKLDLLRAITETYLKIFSTGESIEEQAVVVMWGATFAATHDLPAMTEADRTTHAALSGTIRDGQHEGSIRAGIDADAAAILIMGIMRGSAALSLSLPGAADAAHVRELGAQAITAVLGNPEGSPSQQSQPSRLSPSAGDTSSPQGRLGA